MMFKSLSFLLRDSIHTSCSAGKKDEKISSGNSVLLLIFECLRRFPVCFTNSIAMLQHQHHFRAPSSAFPAVETF
jgi:hypothetical protein